MLISLVFIYQLLDRGIIHKETVTPIYFPAFSVWSIFIDTFRSPKAVTERSFLSFEKAASKSVLHKPQDKTFISFRFCIYRGATIFNPSRSFARAVRDKNAFPQEIDLQFKYLPPRLSRRSPAYCSLIVGLNRGRLPPAGSSGFSLTRRRIERCDRVFSGRARVITRARSSAFPFAPIRPAILEFARAAAPGDLNYPLHVFDDNRPR